MIGIVQVGEQAMADRYMYIPMIGILFAVVWAVWEFADKHAIAKVWIAVPATIILFTLGAVTYHQLGYWENGESIWRYTLTVTNDNYMAHDNLAMVLKQQGRVTESIPEFIEAESLHSYPLPQVFGMGVYLQQNGDTQDAMKMYQKVAAKSPDPRLQAMAWTQMGTASAQLQDYEQATVNYLHALEVDPNDASALAGSALLAERNGEHDQAIAQLSRSAKIQPNDLTFLMLADALNRVGRSEEAHAAEQSAANISADITQARRSASEAERAFGVIPADPVR